MKKVVAILAGLVALLAFSGCSGMVRSDADTVNENLSTAAEQFEVNRKIVFYNGITDKIVATVEGRCSVERDGDKVQAICKVGPNEFSRDEMGRSDNMTYFVIQTAPVAADVYRKRIIIKPQGNIPDIDIVVGK